MSLSVLRTAEEVRAFSAAARGDRQRLALVPTMGFLHAGHLTLIQKALEYAGRVAVSLFVNPTQFGPKEDFGAYPRDLQGDLAKLEGAGASCAFVPDVAEMYPDGDATYVEVSKLTEGLCGRSRPGHFRGVTTVVAKLFALFRPDCALFGEKDYQQLQVIRRMSRDLHFGIDVIGVPTVREPDGLAMSSRNSYLSPEERAQAKALSSGLFAAQRLFDAGAREGAALVAEVRKALSSAKIREDYVELVDAEALTALARVAEGQRARLLVAAFVGKARLIDNVSIG